MTTVQASNTNLSSDYLCIKHACKNNGGGEGVICNKRPRGVGECVPVLHICASNKLVRTLPVVTDGNIW